jgi:hypothetical protein
MKITKAKRKLIPRETLQIIEEKLRMGVPLAKTIRDLDLDISRTVVTKLVRYNEVAELDETVKNSLFPDWLDGKVVKENPDGWVYTGFFPWGNWSYVGLTEAVH